MRPAEEMRPDDRVTLAVSEPALLSALRAWLRAQSDVEVGLASGAPARRLGEPRRLRPLLAEIRAARTAMVEAEKRMRLLIACGREFIEPRPYKLDDLARAAGMSISGVRTAYDDKEIIAVAQHTGEEGDITVIPAATPGGLACLYQARCAHCGTPYPGPFRVPPRTTPACRATRPTRTTPLPWSNCRRG